MLSTPTMHRVSEVQQVYVGTPYAIFRDDVMYASKATTTGVYSWIKQILHS